MGFNKLLAPLAGRAVLLRSIEVYQAVDAIDEMVVVVSGGETLEACQEWQSSGLFSKPVRYVEGGRERHLSVRNGLDLLAPSVKLVAVHDGARPLVATGLIEDCLARAAETGAAASAHRITDTVKRADAERVVTASVEREGLWAMETPQVFSVEVLVSAYDAILEMGATVTDEVSACEMLGHPVTLVENTAANPKITFPADLAMAERLLL